MTIRPVDFNGMIQNTHEAATAKTNEDHKAVLQQQNVQAAVVREEQSASSTVRQMEESQQHEYNYEDGDGDGTGYDGHCRLRGAAYPAAVYGKVAALRAVHGHLLHYLYVLPGAHGESECHQSAGPGRPVSEAGNREENCRSDRHRGDCPHQRHGHGLQSAGHLRAGPDHQQLA